VVANCVTPWEEGQLEVRIEAMEGAVEGAGEKLQTKRAP
jgi:hypothetical protein